MLKRELPANQASASVPSLEGKARESGGSQPCFSRGMERALDVTAGPLGRLLSDAKNGQPKAQNQANETTKSPQAPVLPYLHQPKKAVASAEKTTKSSPDSESGLSFQSSNAGNNNNSGGGSPIQPLQFKTLPRARSSSPAKKRKLHDVIPTYNFLGLDMSEGFKSSSKSKKHKLSRKRPKVVMDSP